jgi:hypothetical protein
MRRFYRLPAILDIGEVIRDAAGTQHPFRHRPLIR